MFSLAVGVGGALGAVSRYWVMSVLSAHRFPWGTLLVNVLGSLLIGLFYVAITERLLLSDQWRAIIVVGFLGAFTTFSTYSLDALLLLQNGQWFKAATYLVSSVLLCLLSAWSGMLMMRAL